MVPKWRTTFRQSFAPRVAGRFGLAIHLQRSAPHAKAGSVAQAGHRIIHAPWRGCAQPVLRQRQHASGRKDSG